MKSLQLTGSLFLVAAFGAIAFAQQSRPTTASAPAQRWEYATDWAVETNIASVSGETLSAITKDEAQSKRLTEQEKKEDANVLDVLNKRGKDGWELVGTSSKPYPSVGPVSMNRLTFYFKRQKQ